MTGSRCTGVKFADAKLYFWQTCTSVAQNSWCYTEGNPYRSAADILCDLVDIVSKNGCLLLNIGPKADGTIPEEDRKILLEIGQWMKVNGEAVYGSQNPKKPCRMQKRRFPGVCLPSGRNTISFNLQLVKTTWACIQAQRL